MLFAAPLLAVGPLIESGDEFLTGGLQSTSMVIADASSGSAVLGLAIVTWGIWQGRTAKGEFVAGLVIFIGIAVSLLGSLGLGVSVLTMGETFNFTFWAPPIALILGVDFILLQNARNAPGGKSKRVARRPEDDDGRSAAAAFEAPSDDTGPAPKSLLGNVQAVEPGPSRQKKKRKKVRRAHVDVETAGADEASHAVDPGARLNRILGGPALPTAVEPAPERASRSAAHGVTLGPSPAGPPARRRVDVRSSLLGPGDPPAEEE